ncbi:hypothetical protein GCM10009837_71370 [Streptomyces durmitorensis]|uniref:Uncharacterized protein n=1 Tax=Streptomyces durmitorensis TaxID=319947 RepID=A0ABY4PWG5_9ACTN|nr:hypothetical protein [Streptomyces durmitorensis]UQT57357.1 hypothetical protein M4V62_20870 [Streptomyces durmitorensis]
MAMVGLFWIAEGDVYVGAKPSGLAAGVRLTPEGVVALGDKQPGMWPWEDVHALAAQDVPVKSLKRNVGVLVDMALTVGLGGGDEAPTMTLRVSDADGDTDLTVYTAAATGYSQTEYDLSRELLSRLTQGAGTLLTTLAAMAEWGRSHEGGTPRAADREELLRTWTES